MESITAPVFDRRVGKHIAEAYRSQLLASWRRQPPFPIGAEELEAHFEGMPARYWERADEDEVLWGLELVHKFLKSITDESSPATLPIVEWRHCPERGFTKVMICTWDRQGLLAKAAAAFSAVRLDILSAEAYTRADQVVLDVFRVSDAEQRPITEAERLQQVLFLLEGSLSDPPRFASVWASCAHKLHPRGDPDKVDISFDNDHSPDHTVLRLDTDNRLGLLSDVLEALADSGVNIAQAIIDTADGLARDTFYLNNAEGGKIVEPARLRSIKERLLAALGALTLN